MNLGVTKEEMWMDLILEVTYHKKQQETDRYNGFSESPLLGVAHSPWSGIQCPGLQLV